MELIDIRMFGLALWSVFLLLTVESGDANTTEIGSPISNAPTVTASSLPSLVARREDHQAASSPTEPTPVTPSTAETPGTPRPPAGDASAVTTAVTLPDYRASTADNGSNPHIRSLVSTNRTDGGVVTDTVGTVHPMVSTSGPLSGRTSTNLPAKTLTGRPSSRSDTAMAALDPQTTPTVPKRVEQSSTENTYLTRGADTSASDSTVLPTESSSSPGVPIPGIITTRTSTAIPGPVTKQPCSTSSSTNQGTGPPAPGGPDCAPSQSGVVSQCLLAIGVLAVMMTAFGVSTVVLCTRLSTRKYRSDGGLQLGTEMVCISALIPDCNESSGDGRRVYSKGPRTQLTALEDSDEDGEDSLTLNSFLPDGDRMV